MNSPAVDLTKYVMPPRPEWNSLGPSIPLWFRRRLAKIDRRLVLQFVPPAPVGGSRMNATLCPDGVWLICRKLRHTGWLFKRSAHMLLDANGRGRQPTPSDLKILRIARNLWRRQETDKLDECFDRLCSQMTKEDEAESVRRCYQMAAEICRKRDVARKLNFVSARGVVSQ